MWSKLFERCVVCGRTDIPFMARGRCASCYQKEYRLAHADTIAESKTRWYRNHPEFHRAQREKRHFGGVRQRVLDRDHHRCTVCGKETGLVVHHKDGLGRGKEGPNNDLDNLTTLCRACHAAHHSKNPGWSRHHACCVQCGRTDRKHNAKGLCWFCYSQNHVRARS